jgi:predicted hydrocarbon binding protein
MAMEPLFEFDEENGVIRDKLTGERCLIVSKTRMQEMFSRLANILFSGAITILFEMNKATGEHFFNDSPKNLKTDKELFIKTYMERFTEAGIGKIELVEFKPEEGKGRLRIYNNFYAELCLQELPACACVEGLLVGLYNRMFQETPQIKRVKCIVKGNPCCEWELSPSKQGQ